MILLPFYWDTSNPNWTDFAVFVTEGGRALWQIDDTDTDAEIIEMLTENGFPVMHLERNDHVVYATIDHTRLVMRDFYLWSEIDPKTSDKDVWRTFQIPVALWSCPIFKTHFWSSNPHMAPLAMPKALTHTTM